LRVEGILSSLYVIPGDLGKNKSQYLEKKEQDNFPAGKLAIFGHHNPGSGTALT
jgi:hypothetical protein